MTKSNKYETQQKSLKARNNPKIFKEYLPPLHSEKKITQWVTKCNNKGDKISDIIIEWKPGNKIQNKQRHKLQLKKRNLHN